MHITGGVLKGRKLKLPRVRIRLSRDEVRQALFNILGQKVVGAEVLDLFSGSGSLGMEAISRGAKSVIFVEKDKRCVKALRENLILVEESKDKGGQTADILAIDAFKAFDLLSRRGRRFDMIFMDPPYYKDLAKKCLIDLDSCDILTPNGLVVVEHYKKDILPEVTKRLRLTQKRRYGDTTLSFYVV